MVPHGECGAAGAERLVRRQQHTARRARNYYSPPQSEGEMSSLRDSDECILSASPLQRVSSMFTARCFSGSPVARTHSPHLRCGNECSPVCGALGRQRDGTVWQLQRTLRQEIRRRNLRTGLDPTSRSTTSTRRITSTMSKSTIYPTTSENSPKERPFRKRTVQSYV
jgi:hypothetical protein